jgi:hypothetical protein
MKNIFRILLLGYVVFFTSCEDTYLPTEQSTLISEGWIENEEAPVVILSRPLIITPEFQSFDDLTDYVIRWAKVSVICEGDTFVLTGKYTSDYVPNYIYTTGKMKGEVGKTYKLVVEYGDCYATAETTILPPPNIVDYNLVCKEKNDKLYQINVTLSDINSDRNYYQSFYKIGLYTKQYFTTFLGTFDDKIIDYEQSIPILKGSNLNTNKDDNSYYFALGDCVSIKVAHIDESSYYFWDAYSQNVSLSYNMFLANTNVMPTNIIGGRGFWCGMGCSSIKIFVGFDTHVQQ